MLQIDDFAIYPFDYLFIYLIISKFLYKVIRNTKEETYFVSHCVLESHRRDVSRNMNIRQLPYIRNDEANG